MADKIVTAQKLKDADKDCDALDQAVSGGDSEYVKTRRGKEYPTMPNAIRQIMENGGFMPFATEAELLTYVPNISPSAAKAMDTKKVWLWKNDGWHDTGLSELEQANTYSKKYGYIINGELQYQYYDRKNDGWVISHDQFAISFGAGRGLVYVAAQKNLLIQLNRMYYVDLANVKSGDTVIGQITDGDWAGSNQGIGSFVENLKIPLFSYKTQGVCGKLANSSTDQLYNYPRSNALWFTSAEINLPKYDKATNTLSWGLIVCAATTRKKRQSIPLSAHSITFNKTDNYQVAWIDLRLVPNDSTTPIDPALVVKVGRYLDVNTDPDNSFIAASYQLPIFYKGFHGARPAPGFFDGLVKGINYESDLTSVNAQISTINDRLDNIVIDSDKSISSKDTPYIENGKIYVDSADGSRLIADVLPNKFLRQPNYVGNAILSTIDKPSLGNNTPVFISDDGALIYPSAKDLLLIFAGHGQSNSIGSYSNPIPETPLYNAMKSSLMMFNGGYDVRLNYSLLNDVVIDLSKATDFIPLQPSVNNTGNGFTFIEGMARRVLHDLETKLGYSAQHVVFTCGKGGVGINELWRGTIPYTNLINAIKKAKEIADKKGLKAWVPCIPFVQGEGDTANISYSADLIALLNQLNEDIKAITGQVSDIKLIIFQASSFYAQNESQKAVYELTKTDSRFILATATYMLDFAADFVHYVPTGNYKLGEYFARAYESVLLRNSFIPVRPKTIKKINSTTLEIEFNTSSALVLDSTVIAKDAGFGFTVTSNGSKNLTVSLKDSKTIQIVTDSAMGSTGVVSYAMTGQTSPRTKDGVPRGCLRDSETFISLVDGKPLYNWCVHFRESF